MLKDKDLMQAVGGIIQRSEKQQEIENLSRSYVDIGVFQQINNLNNQVLYGRRGTGKTHLLKALQFELEKHKKNDVLYLDMRNLGSSSQFLDRSLPITNRCACLFRDILNEIYSSLMTHALTYPPLDSVPALISLDAFEKAIENNHNAPKNVEVEQKVEESSKTQVEGKATINPAKAGLSVAIGENVGTSRATVSKYQIDDGYKVLFPELATVIRDVLDRMAITFYLFLDEWSSIPEDLQPFLAEMLRRGFLPHANFSVKVAALEYKSRFKIDDSSFGSIGLELGGDIAANLDLDDYFVFDRNPNEVSNSAGNILYNHILLEMDETHLNEELGITCLADFKKKLFTSEKTFIELARASEGIPRDLINIFSKSYFNCVKSGRDSIDIKSITEAARQWYEQDKYQNLDLRLANALTLIQRNVIGDHKSKHFMLLREYEREPIIQRLFDARVVHIVRRGYADKSNPGIRYNVYTLDYGTYVDLIYTSKIPDLPLQLDGLDVSEDITIDVPHEDLRSVRRTILDPSIFKSIA